MTVDYPGARALDGDPIDFRKDTIRRVMNKGPMCPADITYPPSMIATAMELAAGVLSGGKKAEKRRSMPQHLMIDVDPVLPENAK